VEGDKKLSIGTGGCGLGHLLGGHVSRLKGKVEIPRKKKGKRVSPKGKGLGRRGKLLFQRDTEGVFLRE